MNYFLIHFFTTSQYAAILQLILLEFIILRKGKMLGFVTPAWLSFSGVYRKQLFGWMMSCFFHPAGSKSDEVKVNVAKWHFSLLYYPFSFHLESLYVTVHFKCRFLWTPFLMWICKSFWQHTSFCNTEHHVAASKH